MLDDISHMPEDFRNWVINEYDEISSNILSMSCNVHVFARNYFDNGGDFNSGNFPILIDREEKKKFAEYVNSLDCDKPIKSALFKLTQVGDLTSNAIYEILWKSLDPTGNVRFFRSENEQES